MKAKILYTSDHNGDTTNLRIYIEKDFVQAEKDRQMLDMASDQTVTLEDIELYVEEENG